MKRYAAGALMMCVAALCLSLTFLFVLSPTDAHAQDARKVLMIPREGYSADLDLMIDMEIGVMMKLLTRAGFEVDIATTSGSPIVGPTKKIEKVLRLSDVNVDSYAGIILPCMAVGGFPGPAAPPLTVAAVKKALSAGKPVAAPYGSVFILADAGLLKGKRYALIRDPLQATPTQPRIDSRFEGAVYAGPGVVQDGNIITSGVCPNLEKQFALQNGTVALTERFIAAIGPKRG